MLNKECVFCNIISKKEQANIIYEDELICCLLDIDPINEGHVLIVPKSHRHNIYDLDDEVLLRILSFSKKIARILEKLYKCDGYTIMQNGGVFTDFGHFHMHIFPRYIEDGFSWTCKDSKKLPLKEVKEKLKLELIKEV